MGFMVLNRLGLHGLGWGYMGLAGRDLIFATRVPWHCTELDEITRGSVGKSGVPWCSMGLAGNPARNFVMRLAA